MRQGWNYFQSLSSRERWLFLQALGLLPLFHWGIRSLGLAQSCQWLARWSVSARSSAQQDMTSVMIQQSEQVLYWASHYGLQAGNCLSQSLTLCWLLRRQGIPTELRIGVRRQAGKFEAHAWLEYNGQPIKEVATVRQQYAAFPTELFAALSRQ
ncbi:MAG: lasso peptide biosynthesis B2 protein [Caldilineaceae bacterium]